MMIDDVIYVDIVIDMFAVRQLVKGNVSMYVCICNNAKGAI